MTGKWDCIICGTIVEDFEPEMCCDGRECGCYGKPIEPPLCSRECTEKIYGVPVGGWDTKEE